jgi:hypothetical protein
MVTVTISARFPDWNKEAENPWVLPDEEMRKTVQETIKKLRQKD